IDAMILVDWLLSRVMQHPHRASESVNVLQARSCVIQISKKLENEVLSNVYRRGVFFPPEGLLPWRELTHGWTLSQRVLDEVALPKKVVHAVPPKDLHLVRLAVATNTV